MTAENIVAPEPPPDSTDTVINAASVVSGGDELSPGQSVASAENVSVVGDDEETFLSYGVPAAERALADDDDTLLAYGVPSSERSMIDDGDTVLNSRLRERRAAAAAWQHPAGPVPVRDDRDTIPTPASLECDEHEETILNAAVSPSMVPPAPPAFVDPYQPYGEPVAQPATNVWLASQVPIEDTDPAVPLAPGGDLLSVAYATTESAPHAYPLGTRDGVDDVAVAVEASSIQVVELDDEDTVLGALGARVYSDDDGDTVLDIHLGESVPFADTEDGEPVVDVAAPQEQPSSSVPMHAEVPIQPAAAATAEASGDEAQPLPNIEQTEEPEPPVVPPADDEETVIGRLTPDDEDTVLGIRTADEEDTVLGLRTLDDEDTVLGQSATDNEDTVLGQSPTDNEDTVLGLRTLDEEDTILGLRALDEEDTVLGLRELDDEDTVLGLRTLDEEDTVLGGYAPELSSLPPGEDTIIGFSEAMAEQSITDSVGLSDSAGISDSVDFSAEETQINPRFALVTSHDPLTAQLPIAVPAEPTIAADGYVAPGVDDAETVLNVLGQVVDAPLGLPAIPVPLPEAASPLTTQPPIARDESDTLLSGHLSYRDDETLITPVETGDMADTMITPPPPPPPAKRSAAKRKRQAPMADGELPPLPPLPPLPTPPPARAEPRFVAGVSLTDGRVMAIVGTLIFGRKPRSTRIISGRLPSLVQVHSPAGSISATHLELRQEGMAVVATDLASANGTIVTVPGMSPRRMRQGEAMAVIPGTILDIGDGVALTILPFQRKDDA